QPGPDSLVRQAASQLETKRARRHNTTCTAHPRVAGRRARWAAARSWRPEPVDAMEAIGICGTRTRRLRTPPSASVCAKITVIVRSPDASRRLPFGAESHLKIGRFHGPSEARAPIQIGGIRAAPPLRTRKRLVRASTRSNWDSAARVGIGKKAGSP